MTPTVTEEIRVDGVDASKDQFTSSPSSSPTASTKDIRANGTNVKVAASKSKPKVRTTSSTNAIIGGDISSNVPPGPQVDP